MLPHSSTNFKTQKYYKNGPKFNSVYSSNNLRKIKNGAFVINLDAFKSIGDHWIALQVYDSTSCDANYFDSFVVEHIPKGIKRFIGN